MTTTSNANQQQISSLSNSHTQPQAQLQASSQASTTKQSSTSSPPKKSFWPSWTGFSGKTLWDWFSVFLLSLTIAWFGFQQSQTALQVSVSQHVSDQKIAQANHQADQELAADQQRAATLNTYLVDMKDLIFNHGLATSKAGDPIRSLARAETQSTLSQLDGKRKRVVFEFLLYASLIDYDQKTDTRAIIAVSRADLSNVDLSSEGGRPIDLAGDNFNNANLSDGFFEYSFLAGDTFTHANLHDAHLHGTSFIYDDLSYANLSNADLTSADLRAASLTGADLSNANLKGAQLTEGALDQVKTLKGAIMPDGSKHP